ncbi:MAG TPA: hypothetical protein VJZ49_05985 [Syntrophales bacterium]|nr:hypothetical protein [Syntrophales bacterium]
MAKKLSISMGRLLQVRFAAIEETGNNRISSRISIRKGNLSLLTNADLRLR